MRIAHQPGSRQRGVVLIFTLIILLILSIGAVALVQSMKTSLAGAGNLAFRRDLANQGEKAVSKVLAQFSTGGILVGSASTQNNVPGSNYSATMLPTTGNIQGIPNDLMSSDATFTAAWTAGDLTGTSSDILIRYVIDRLCSQTGAPINTQCVQSSAASPTGDTKDAAGLSPPSATVYRLSVRITDARNTQVYLQTTFTKPD